MTHFLHVLHFDMCVCVCVYVCVCIYLYLYTYLYLHVYVYLSIYIYIYIYISMYLYVYMYMYIYIYAVLYMQFNNSCNIATGSRDWRQAKDEDSDNTLRSALCTAWWFNAEWSHGKVLGQKRTVWAARLFAHMDEQCVPRQRLSMNTISKCIEIERRRAIWAQMEKVRENIRVWGRPIFRISLWNWK